MKIVRALLSAFLIVSAYAKWNACGLSDWRVGIKGYIQGFQASTTSRTTDCFVQGVTAVSSAATFGNSFYYIAVSDFLAPIYKFADLGIELTNAMSYCQTVNFAKQLAVRTTTWGGFIESMLTIIMAFVRNAVNPNDSDLYNAFELAFAKSDSCTRTARSVG